MVVRLQSRPDPATTCAHCLILDGAHASPTLHSRAAPLSSPPPRPPCPGSYACYLPAVRVAGLEPRLLPVTAATGHLPDLSSPAAAAAAGSAAPRCRALLLNYPNNPTAAVAGDVFWQAALDFCERHDLL